MPLKVDFWYPTDISRPYMPDPKRNFEAFAASLNKSGFKVVPHSAPWSPDYVGRVDDGKAGALNLIGWTGDYGDPDNFIGVFFQQPTDQFGFTNDEITNTLDKAETETDAAKRTELYKEANREIMRVPPGRSLCAHEACARVRGERQGLRPEPGLARAVLDLSRSSE